MVDLEFELLKEKSKEELPKSWKMKRETEGLLIAAKDQALHTRK